MRATTDSPTGTLASILPAHVAVDETDQVTDPLLLDAEQPFAAKFARTRLVDFAAGRACARRALHRLGVPDAERCLIPISELGQPGWPAGVVGSITHCPGRWAATVARSEHYRSIGIDVEVRTELGPRVAELTSHAAELAILENDPDVEWPLLLFSAREAVYKCWSPVVGTWLDYLDVALHLDTSACTFTARPAVPLPPEGRQVLASLVGAYTWTEGHVCTAAWVTAG